MAAKLFPYLLLAPYLIAFVIFLAFPIVRGFYMSLFDWGIFGPREFLGLKNYATLFEEPQFWQAFSNTLTFTIMYVPMVVILSLVLAVLLSKKIRGMGWFRTAFFLPIVINVATATIAVRWLLDSEIGVVNRLLAMLNLPTQSWLNQEGWAMFAVALVSVWSSSGINIVMFLAGLENIPQELYEAVMVDGGNAWHKFTKITLPLLRPFTLLVTILSLIRALQVFGEIYMLTQGGPYGSTTVLTYLLYEEGFTYFRFGTAAAIGVFMTLLIAVVSLIQFKLFQEK
ncbi:MAG: sugar ABC transporter permease [Firmicutes bacterium]|nr:sugar ABC transporter permease [Bacillota bacterium]